MLTTFFDICYFPANIQFNKMIYGVGATNTGAQIAAQGAAPRPNVPAVQAVTHAA